ncbi:tRNA (adenosine(37)-N6)-threonylcarbamoyltransferase complex transferase subunit TsaD [Helicobacter muridarum]|uniref:tRNA N6-adenosine threonylcarbamoyltransferase n=1 Tax=Helicobacter muridarum TaxID=216 RepID=A0A377PSD0_9HELI|nr:tRNA (adenosine(37)-N6)-threonylcarbamoyltransferase complex transferase subunit TsaD [Helicobacter muridarum]TLD98070.1 tRNA (adenosine(37)-N6)-threonylcarbamoyltransferase complex transferase subunit TsaD [Helicobacter muridarum]STQ85746.1 glycoprotease [Helicobacter muridarum]
MNVLSIESSCDDSSIALQSLDCRLLWHRKISQEYAHSYFGGVVPELASRLFARDLPHLLREFSKEYSLNDISAIAVTNEPGLATSLLEGVIMAKSLCISLGVPLIGINHLKGHIYSLFIGQQSIKMPLSVLLVSGGHTMIIECLNYKDMRIISSTLDDSFGECYDKVAKMLSLGYPGGMIIDSLAKEAYSSGISPISLPIPLANSQCLDFSFSGLKNAFRLALQEQVKLQGIIHLHTKLLESVGKEMKKLDLSKSRDSIDSYKESNKDINLIREQILSSKAAKALSLGLQQSAVKHLLQKCEKYLKDVPNIPYFAVVGGASANSLLRKELASLAAKYNKELLLADIQYCSDNAAMIGRAAIAHIESSPNILHSFNVANSLGIDISPRNQEIQSNV